LSGNVGDGVGVFPLFGPGDSFGTLPVPVVGDGVGITGGVNGGITTVQE